MKANSKRLFIYPQDVSKIMGVTDRSARRLLKTIREHFTVPHGVPVSIRDFCNYTRQDPDELKWALND